ncbi:1-aminocyclopropane-1-carboxylate oxidase homolog 11-like [Aristolochia californica]|uniref:1-aminocyclopropane-1-carboxylate oxidase homolog 11-like n=1 Tax=Aristolochia californica TaxID=171875 RepID=UPI0035DE31AB
MAGGKSSTITVNEAVAMAEVKTGTLMIPIIDLAGVIHGSRRAGIVKQIQGAMAEWGIFQVLNHGISSNVLQEMLEGSRRFHEEDMRGQEALYSWDLKKKVRYRSHYCQQGARPGWKGSLIVEMAPEPPAHEELPSVCREILIEYVKHVSSLGETLFEVISEALGLEADRLKQAKCDEGMLVSCHYYPPCPNSEPKIGSVQHSDPSFLTVLLQDQIGGLQVLHDGNWVNVTPVHGALVVNVGDFLRLVTNDKLKSVVHRVMVDDVSPRLSVACLFVYPTSTMPFGPLKEFVSEGNGSLYREITSQEYFVHLLSKVVDCTSGLAEFKL